MRFKRVLIAAALVLFAGAFLQSTAALAGYQQNLADCAASAVDGRVLTIGFFGHRFKCPGRIIVADENEIKRLPGYSNDNAYFRGVVIREGGGRLNYWIVVESWARNCKIPPPLVRVGNGQVVQAWVRDYPFGGEADDRGEYARPLQSDWTQAAQLIAKAVTRKWADAYEFSRCNRDWNW